MWVPECPWVAPWRQPGFDRRDDGVALDELSGLDVNPMHPKGFGDLLHVGDRRPGALARAGSADGAHVGDLAAGLGVKRRAVQDQFHPIRAGAFRAACATTGTRLPSTKMPKILASEVNSSNPVNSVGPASTSSR